MTTPRPPHRISRPEDLTLARALAAELRTADSPEPVRDLDDDTALRLAFRLVRVTQVTGWTPPKANPSP